MIDLKKIEAKVDALLESETKESLTKWWLKKRNKELSQFLGNGTYVDLKSQSSFISPETNLSPKTKVVDDHSTIRATIDCDYPLAA